MSHQAGLPRLPHERTSGPHHHGHAHSLALGRARAERVQPLWPRSEPPGPPAIVVPPTAVRPDEIRFVRLRTPEEIARVLPLRREINLHVADPDGFAVLEKKETRAALSADSSGVDKPSVPSGSSRSVAASHPAKPSSTAHGFRRSCSRMAGK